jgi:hypothetical protein
VREAKGARRGFYMPQSISTVDRATKQAMNLKDPNVQIRDVLQDDAVVQVHMGTVHYY